MPARYEALTEGPCTELELLLCAARTRMAPARADRIKVLLRGDIDWEYLMGLARRHGLRSLLYRQLSASCPELVPPEYLGQLRDHFHINTQRNLYQAGELLKVIDLLGSQGITALPLKGPLLAASCYGHLGLREFVDLDLLIHRRDVPRIETLLLDAGYRPLGDCPGARQVAAGRPGTGLHLRRDYDDTDLDLEQDLLPGLDSERLWGHIEEEHIGGTVVPSLSAEDQLVFLCLHGAKHLWERLEWICDTAELIRGKEDLDWEVVVYRAGTLHCKRILFLGLLLARDLLGTVLPVEMTRRVEGDTTAGDIADQVKRRIFADVSRSPDTVEQGLFLIKATERLRDKIKMGAHIAWASIPPTPAERSMISLPPALSFLYWIIRPVRLIGKYGLRPLRNRT